MPSGKAGGMGWRIVTRFGLAGKYTIFRHHLHLTEMIVLDSWRGRRASRGWVVARRDGHLRARKRFLNGLLCSQSYVIICVVAS